MIKQDYGFGRTLRYTDPAIHCEGRMYQDEWAARKRDPKELSDVSQLLSAIGTSRQQIPALQNLNQYLISRALLSAEICNFDIDVSNIINQTGLASSSVYKALRRMSEKKLIEYYTLEGNRRRKCVRATKLLIDQHIDFFDAVKKDLDAYGKSRK